MSGVNVNANQLRIGALIEYENQIYRIFELQHITPGNLRAKVQIKMKNIENGVATEHRFRSDEKVKRVSLEQKEVEYLYDEGDSLTFMDGSTYEQISLPKEFLGDAVGYLTPNMKVSVTYYQEKAVGVELPVAVELKVVSAGVSMKGATVTNQYKSVKVETGLEIQVPAFIKEGDVIKVEVETGKYLERARTA